MKAILCTSHGPAQDLEIREVDDPVPGPEQPVVDVYAASLNFPDTLQIQGKYQFQPPMPFTPGSEVGGVVSATGDGVGDFTVGDRVVATASSDEKLEFVRQLNPDELINYGDGELKEKVKDLTGGKGADVIYDPVGGGRWGKSYCR